MAVSANIGSASPSIQSPFAALLRIELRRAFGGRQAIGLVVVALMGVLLAFWLPTFPESVLHFFQRIFQLTDWSAIVFANDLVGIMFFVYWIGVFEVLTIYVVPLEERHLDLYLSKPLTRRQYMLARLIPIMLVLTASGTISALVHWLALVAAGLDYQWLSYLGASAVVVAWTVCLVGIVNLAILSARETYTAALIAFIPIAAAILPGSIYMYRPDLFDGAPLFRAMFVFPITLLWHPDFSARWGIALAALLFGITVALIVASGRRIEARDIG
jgi:hypothetical protein